MSEASPNEAKEIDEMKKMSKAALLLAVAWSALLVSGCGDITTKQLNKAVEYCSDKGGIRALRQHTLKQNVVICMDDAAEFIQGN